MFLFTKLADGPRTSICEFFHFSPLNNKKTHPNRGYAENHDSNEFKNAIGREIADAGSIHRCPLRSRCIQDSGSALLEKYNCSSLGLCP